MARARELVWVAVLLSLPVMMLRANLRSQSDLNFVDHALVRISAPLQSWVVTALESASAGWSRYIGLVHVGEDNVHLRVENAQLKQEMAKLQDQARRGTELRALLTLRRELGTETLAARVIGAEMSSMFRVMRIKIDRGELEVSAGMPVLTPEGVVGRIHRVSGPYADVLLATDPLSTIYVSIKRTGSLGVLRGIPGDSRYRMRIEKLSRKDEIKEGDDVETSDRGGFPAGRAIGKIVHITRGDSGLYQEAEVEPAIDLSRLHEVLVVLTPQSPPDKPTAAKGAR